jgi:hypothetical protein
MSRSLNHHEKSLRKQWLVISIIAILAWPLITLGFMTFISMKEHIPAGIYWVYLVIALLTVLIFYVLYRCAYVKPGIRFLTFVLIVGPLLKLKATIDALKVSHDHVTLIALVVNLGFYAWWYYLSLKLRQMNKKIG